VYRIPISFHDRLLRGENPTTYAIITTHLGYRAYAEKELSQVFDISGYIADGSITADGTYTAGSGTIGVIDKAARVLDMGSVERTLQPRKDDILAAYGGRQLQHISIELDNTDRYFSRLIAKESFIGRPIAIRCGFEADSYAAHVNLFTGVISEIELGSGNAMVLEADERGATSATGVLLPDTCYLKRAGRYGKPLNTNDRLPIVYGDLTDGTLGLWECPCINTDDYVYCFAGHEVLTVANGNSITVYENDLLLDPAMYAFNAANNYESLGTIATIDFTTPKTGSIITVRGMGKPTATGGATLMDNVIDIVNDFLTVENDFTASIYEATAKARASQVFTAQSYAAAGVINEDVEIWETVSEMMASFLGGAYLDGDGELVLEIDNNTFPYQYGQSGVIPRSDSEMVSARQQIGNIINKCPCNYRYSYRVSEFMSQTDDTAHADAISQSVHGVREPNTPYQFYWCRDLTSVQKVQDIIVAKLKDPIYEIEIEDKTVRRVGNDIGDIIIYSSDAIYDDTESPLYNHYWKTIGVNRDFAKGTITFRALQTAYYLTVAYLADGTYLADGSIHAGSARSATIH